MRRHYDLVRSTYALLTTLMVGAACLVTRPDPAIAEPTSDAAAQADGVGPAATAPARAGQWIHVDPRTGQRVAAPPSAALTGRPEFSTSHEGLVEQPAPGGGTMVDLQGRFRSAATATVGADGKPKVDCIAPGTVGHEK